MAVDKKYQLKIRRDGVVRYLMEDGSFWMPKNCPQLEIHRFPSRTAAKIYWQHWAHNNPLTAMDWSYEIEEM